MIPENLFKAGYVSKAHGLKGEITVNLEKVILPDEVLELFLEANGDYKNYSVEHFSARPDKAFIKLAGVNTLEGALELRGHVMYLKIPARKKRSSQELYDEEIQGFFIDDLHHGRIGQVTGVSNLPGNKLIEVAHEGREILIPVDGPFILKIDRRKKVITVDMPDGFLDI